MRYDAIIVGASFAGLAVASRLGGNVLLIDRKEVGTGQTSACGTLLNVPESLGVMDSVLQVYHKGYIHAPDMTVDYDLSYPFCAFDYGRFCQGLFKRTHAEFLQARVRGIDGDRVVTDKGEFEATCLVDASGWRAALAASGDSSFVNPVYLSFGLETEVPLAGSGLYFWLDPSVVPNGVGWLFPCGDHSRIGVASYEGSNGVRERLSSFAGRLGTTFGNIHGGFLTWRLRSPTVGRIFVVGDAAGQCLPFTGEGIRPALYFGLRCGDLVQRVIQGEVSLEQGLHLYRAQVERYRKWYFLLELLQRRLPPLPPHRLLSVMLLARSRPLWHLILKGYEYLAAPRRTGESFARRTHHP